MGSTTGRLGPYRVTKRPMAPLEKIKRFGDLRRGAIPGRLLASDRARGPRPVPPPGKPPKRTS
jgi:hypothetical protein